jgi:hypothetical protein
MSAIPSQIHPRRLDREKIIAIFGMVVYRMGSSSGENERRRNNNLIIIIIIILMARHILVEGIF